MEERVKQIIYQLLSAAAVCMATPAYFACLFWKLTAVVLAYVLWEEKASIMRGPDALFALEPNNSRKNAAVLSWIVLDGQVSLPKLRRRVRETLVEAGQSVRNFKYR